MSQMKKEFEACYSKNYAWIFAFFTVLFLVGILLLSIFWIPTISLIFITVLSLISLVFVYMFVITIRKEGTAVAVTEDKLILYKKEPVEIPLGEILKISIHDGNGSFDFIIKTSAKKYSMHCFIKEEQKKKKQFLSLLKQKGIPFTTFDIN